MPNSFAQIISAARWWCLVVVPLGLVLSASSAFAREQRGCESVGYGQQASTQYSLENLRKRIEIDPTDVDALINLGIRFEEQGRLAEADALYEKAIQARPECYLGYYFAGLLEDRISTRGASDAEAKIHKALGLDSSLRNDPNVEGFLRRRRPSEGGASPQTAQQSATNSLLTSTSGFLVGVGVGLLLAAPILYLMRRRQRAST